MFSENPIIKRLENAKNPILDEICKDGQEEAFRIWDDPSHPLMQALRILLRAQADVFAETPEALALLEALKAGEPPASFFGLSGE
jgi:hypothetical protein